ncbi:hypothetical protein IU449_27155 [Nocardia higoensis]|uniref:Uncharacterized protein n=1 Tax=Nocardia higoensis TaxID=228599 RepID=A0ABS0DI96_9NOCA|nr:hypothetical protein [Nocardia higoensis]MBF6358179.1 hypothetical protein [Nocardia higoensis]
MIDYSTPSLTPTTPGADWFIEGCRYREVSRTPVTTDGEVVSYTVTLERADADELLGLYRLDQEPEHG